MNTMRNMTFLAAAACVALASTALPASAQQAAAQQSSADEKALIAKGEYIARAGDCVACHTGPGGKPFAGGLALHSDVGTIISTNITPDKQFGIGGYTEAQFSAAVRDGIRGDGAHLYPAMPYTAYAKVSDQDIHALYTYFMKAVEPVAAPTEATSLTFPFNMRFGLGLWNKAFAGAGAFKPDPKASPEINRGAYLVEGLGHCGSCHTPRGFAMQEEGMDASNAAFLTGGELDGWPVPSLRGPTKATKGFASWTQAEIVDYLGTGRNAHAAVGGEMKPAVEHSLAYLNDADLNAIAAYLKSVAQPGQAPAAVPEKVKATTDKLTAAKDLTLGERLYLDNCGACHFAGGQGAARVFPALDGASIVNADNPNGLIATILGGAQTPSTDRSPSVLPMPGFGYRLTDKEVASLATFLRSGWSNQAGPVSADQVAAMRAKLPPQPVPGIQIEDKPAKGQTAEAAHASH